MAEVGEKIVGECGNVSKTRKMMAVVVCDKCKRCGEFPK